MKNTPEWRSRAKTTDLHPVPLALGAPDFVVLIVAALLVIVAIAIEVAG